MTPEQVKALSNGDLSDLLTALVDGMKEGLDPKTTTVEEYGAALLMVNVVTEAAERLKR